MTHLDGNIRHESMEHMREDHDRDLGWSEKKRGGQIEKLDCRCRCHSLGRAVTMDAQYESEGVLIGADEAGCGWQESAEADHPYQKQHSLDGQRYAERIQDRPLGGTFNDPDDDGTHGGPDG